MIGQRYVVAPRLPTRARAAEHRQWLRHPAVAGRERLAESLHGSVLAQLVLAMACVALAGLLYMAQASQSSVRAYNIAVLQSQQLQLTMQNATLHATATNLQSLQRIDSVATTQLHMVRPDSNATTIWIWPALPTVVVPPDQSADTLAAQRRSQPLAWLRRLATFVKSSL